MNSQRPLFVAVLGALMSTSAFSVETSLPALPLLVSSLGVSAREAQLVITFTVIGIAIGQIPVGIAADRYGRIRVVTVCLAIYASASLVAALSRDLPLILAARLLLGIGACCGTVIARAIVRDVATDARATQLMAVLFAILAGALIVAPLVGSALVALSGWRLVFGGIALYGLLVLVAVNALLPETGRYNAQSITRREQRARDRVNQLESAERQPLAQQLVQSTRAYLRSPQSLLATAVFSLAFCGFFAFVTTSSTVAHDVFAIRPERFGGFYAAVASTYLLGSTLTRYCVARVGARAMLGAAVGLLGATGLVLLLVTERGSLSLAAFWGLMMVYSLGFGIVTPTTNSLAIEPLPDVAGFASSILGTIQTAAGALASAVTAALYAGSTESVTLIMGLAGLATAAVYVIGRRALSASSTTNKSVSSARK